MLVSLVWTQASGVITLSHKTPGPISELKKNKNDFNIMASMKPDDVHSAGRLTYPPLDGSLLFPELLEYNARHNPGHPYFIYPGDGEVQKISHLEFYCACQRVAHAVRPGRQGKDKEVVVILANCDTILYQALFMGIIYAGLIVGEISLWSRCIAKYHVSAVSDVSKKFSTCCHRYAQEDQLPPHDSITNLTQGSDYRYQSPTVPKWGSV